MNEDLITIARKHGDEVSNGGKVTYEFDSWGLTAFAEELEAAEREACAKVAEAYEPRCDICPRGVAFAIRERGAP